MKIKVTTRMRQSPEIEINERNILGMQYWERIKLLNEITDKIPELENWFEQFLFALCLQFGEELPDSDINEFKYELEL
jgi:hypothetical protein